jgi:hypothetical protein
MVNLFAHLDVDHPSIADYDGQSTEPVFLQRAKAPRSSVASRSLTPGGKPVTEFGLSNGHPGC